ncbi:YfaP family protein [Aquirhabdus parva]|uniref:DUF2135 domain-containing protein n=1 Tax=Aquirhabdus parva TaxID=2283318 RepID=A0A345PAB3_9GAMM|nr:DUF2135 domain-containing protein [Aquirhabdus parva]AXI04222.1 DUF2135 domain-containing protein [Aquirhabdus parva]
MHNNKIRGFRLLSITGAVLVLVGSGLMMQADAEGTTASRPTNGWRFSDSSQGNFSQTVNYPATHTNSGGHAWSALIEGQIKAAPKSKDQPATMVANGVTMPLSIDESGHYQRPYAFGSGSNSIEVRTANGDKTRRQFYEANAGKVPAKIRVVMSWDTNHTDVDLHVVTPNREHAWYGQRTIPSGGSIDIDATDGYGPEIFATPNAVHGTYLIYANYYGGESSKVITTVTVTVITNENTPNEKQQTYIVPLRKVGELTQVAQFIY